MAGTLFGDVAVSLFLAGVARRIVLDVSCVATATMKHECRTYIVFCIP